MSSSLSQQESALWIQLTTDYTMTAMTTLMVYHYLLSIGLEIQLIWTKKYSAMTFVYITLRYFGMLWAVSILVYSLEIPFSNTTCLWLCAVLEICEAIVVFTLQGMITLRVYLLLSGVLKNPVVALVFLAIGFSISQAFNVIGTMLYVATSVGHTTDNDILGVKYCGDAFNSDALGKVTWTILFPLANYSMIAFEATLGVSAMYYVIGRMHEGGWRDHRSLQGAVVSVLVRDNLLYFFANFLLLVILVLQQVPTIQASNIWNNISISLQYLVYTMLGPWIMLNLRERLNSGLQAGLRQGYTTHNWLTTLHFTNATPVHTVAYEMGATDI